MSVPFFPGFLGPILVAKNRPEFLFEVDVANSAPSLLTQKSFVSRGRREESSGAESDWDGA